MYTHEEMTNRLLKILEESQQVVVHWERIPVLAKHLKYLAHENRDIIVPAWANPAKILDEFPLTNSLNTIQFFFVMIAQGYQHYLRNTSGQQLIWEIIVDGKRKVGVHAQYACACRALQNGMNILNPDFLIYMKMKDVENFYLNEANGKPNLPDLQGRLERFHEVGSVLHEKYQDHYCNLLRVAEGYLFRNDGGGIVQQLVTNFPVSYGDWPFCKLAFTPARMLYDRRRDDIPTIEGYSELTDIKDPENFEAGADVARPFALLRLGILEASPALVETLKFHLSVGKNAQLFDEIRAASMLVCRDLVKKSGISSPAIGGELWATGFYSCPKCLPPDSKNDIQCHHKSICQAYQGQLELFEIAPMAGTGD